MELEILELDIYKHVTYREQVAKIFEEIQEYKESDNFENEVEEICDVIQAMFGGLRALENEGKINVPEAWQKHCMKLLDRQNAKGGGEREG